MPPYSEIQEMVSLEAADTGHDEFVNVPLRPVEQVAQEIILSDFDFEKKTFRLFTKLVLNINDLTLSEFYLDIGDGCKLPNEMPGFDGNVTLNGYNANYIRVPAPKVEIPPNDPKSLENYRRAVEHDFTAGPSSLLIRIPNPVREQGLHMINLCMDCMVVNPKGVNFVLLRDEDGNLLPISHMYTFRSDMMSSTHEWLPCIDQFHTLGIFEVAIIVPKLYGALATGEHIETIEDDDFAKYMFRHLVPTMPCNVGFAVGNFESYVHPDIPEVVFHCIPGSLTCLKHTVAQCGRVFEFFEELLSSRFPFPCYHMLFVYNTPDDFTSYSGFSIMSADILYHKKIIDRVHPTRKVIVNAIASQFFGCFIQPIRFNDIWLIKALARFITFLYVERVFGSCEYVYEVYMVMKEVCDFENRFGKICLYPRVPEDIADSFSNPTCPGVFSPKQGEMAILKGFLVMRMLHDRLGKEPFMKVLHQLVYSATRYGDHKLSRAEWAQLFLGVDSFFFTVFNVTGREVPTLIEQWIYSGGHPYFEIHYNLNKRRNMIELEIKQELKKGRQIYTGPLNIVVQELDGSYTHTVQIDKDFVRDDIQCHSKGRNKKRKKVLLSIGEEVEMDFSKLDPEVSVLWLRVDPDMLLIREISLNQPILFYEYMVLYERNIPAQLFALDVLKTQNTVQTVGVLNDVIKNDNWFYQVRNHAMKALANTRTRLSANVMPHQGMVEMFEEFFGCKSTPEIVASNNVVVLPKSLQMYLLQQEFAKAIALQRDQRSRCPPEVVNFLLGLLYFNDNSLNRFTDDFLIAAYIQALGRTLCLADNHNPDLQNLDPLVRKIIAEVTRTLNLEMMKPSFGRVIQIACLHVLCELQRLEHIPIDLDLFWLFADPKCNYVDTRIAAVQCIVKLIKSQNKTNDWVNAMPIVIKFILEDENPRFIYRALSKVAENPPFHFLGESGIKARQLPVNSEGLFNLLWNKMRDERLPRRVCLLLMDLFYVFYGTQVPEIYVEPPERMVGPFMSTNGHV
uniref:Transcription initiation factor TFIID subunit 2 n=1 Tax=Panagrolaimus sp. JU765 TaxID=591449 RepID=A0AC34QZ36_9BILA